MVNSGDEHIPEEDPWGLAARFKHSMLERVPSKEMSNYGISTYQDFLKYRTFGIGQPAHCTTR
eukprot:1914251-Prorocentrum_lima.AAC.1